jgi:hypothetical protein
MMAKAIAIKLVARDLPINLSVSRVSGKQVLHHYYIIYDEYNNLVIYILVKRNVVDDPARRGWRGLVLTPLATESVRGE